MVCLCRASCFCRLLSSYRYCRSARWLRGLINSRRYAGTATASCRAMISHRITAFQLTPRKLRFRAWCAATGALGISIQSQVITGTMATGTISAGLAFTVVATMAAALALAGRGRRSGRSGIAADQAAALPQSRDIVGWLFLDVLLDAPIQRVSNKNLVARTHRDVVSLAIFTER